jgi:hypothetical protein
MEPVKNGPFDCIHKYSTGAPTSSPVSQSHLYALKSWPVRTKALQALPAYARLDYI